VDPTQIAGRFDVEGVAGSGGLGVVYRCRDRARGTPVAVKVAPRTSPKLRERFLREAEMLSTITHPNVVRYVGHGLLETEEPYLAMEWIDGEDLHVRLERAPLTLAESVALARHVASALAAAHAVGIVHRDVKPANVILVGKDPTAPKLIDFGIARAGAQLLTQPGGVLGTPGYMAPEQARGEAMIDARADVFSLGCLLYECLSGRRAFDGDSPMAILAKVLLEEPPALRTLRPEIPAALDHLVQRMLSKSKEARYASASDVVRDLDRLDTSTEENILLGTSLPGALTTRERKLLCLLLARPGEAPAKDATLVDDPISGSSNPAEPDQALRELASSMGTNAEILVDGSLVVVIEGFAAVDQAVRAARAALRLRARGARGMRIAIATGRGEITGTMPFGEVVDRACALLDAPHQDGVRIDALTSNLVEGRFRQSMDAHGALLAAELDAESVRTMFGRTTSCIGRERELGTLVALFDEMREENAPRLAIVTGDAGIGKSRLRVELAARLAERGVLWLVGGGDVAQPGAPFGALQAALRRELGLRPELTSEERQTRVVDRLARATTRENAEKLSPFLAQLAGIPLDDAPDSALRTARADATVMGDALRAAWQDFVEAEGKKRPIVLVLEDMQWGDRPSITLATAAIRALKSTPLFVLVTARPEIFSVFPDLLARGVTHVELGPLGAKASTRLLKDLLDDQTDETIERVAQQAGGNPFLLEELARAVMQGRGAELPETVLATAQARLETLSPSHRRVLRAAAVLGDSLSDAGLAALLVDLAENERRAGVAELVREDILEPRDSGGWRFRQAVLRDASYASLTAADKKLAHSLAAKWLEARGGADAVTLATHMERAGRPAEACKHLVDAAEQSLEGSDIEGAFRLLDHATACGASGETLGRLLLLRTEAHRWRGQQRDARDCAARATKLLPEGTAPWLKAKVFEATTSGLLGDLKPIEALAVLLCILLEGGDTSGNLLAAGGAIIGMLAQYRVAGAALARLARALKSAIATCRDERAVGMVLSGLSTEASSRDELEEGLELCIAGAEALRRGGDLRNTCNTHINVGYALMQLGQHKRAETALREGLAIAERVDLRAQAALANHNLGPTLAQLGDHESAEKREREAIRAYAEQGDLRLGAASHLYLGRILLARGRLEEAEREMREACTAVANVEAILPFAMSGLTMAELALGKKENALATARDAMAKVTARGGAVEDPLAVKLALVEALLANHEDVSALVAELAIGLLERASRLKSADLRHTFLHEVREHARIFEIQKGLAGTE
jgi:serine/threonine protein kinase/tetratricopeptide (TPR) repeat protein